MKCLLIGTKHGQGNPEFGKKLKGFIDDWTQQMTAVIEECNASEKAAGEANLKLQKKVVETSKIKENKVVKVINLLDDSLTESRKKTEKISQSSIDDDSLLKKRRLQKHNLDLLSCDHEPKSKKFKTDSESIVNPDLKRLIPHFFFENLIYLANKSTIYNRD